MAETKPTRLLDVSSNMENNEQLYVEVGSNIYLGTKDGIKYSLIQAPDSKFRLVEAASDSSISLSDSSGSFEASKACETSNVSNIKWSESLNESKEFKQISFKSEPSPCKGQGDEFGNTVLSPHNFTPSIKETDCDMVEKIKQGLTPENLNNSSVLSYTTLYPKKDSEPVVQKRVKSPDMALQILVKSKPLQHGQRWSVDSFLNSSATYYVNPRSSYNSYSPTFPSPVTIRPARGARKSRMPFMPPSSPYTPVPRVRRGTPRMRRPRMPLYQYTPQILHSTPTSLTNTNFGTDNSLSLSGCSSSILSSSSLTKSDSSVGYPRVPNNTPTTPETDSSGNQKVVPLQWVPFVENYLTLDPRETHNEKERYRRLRIKNACHSMRSYMPWLDGKTDNATIFEEAVNFIEFARENVGREYDEEFMDQSYIY